jgi:hypothetical protein
MEGEFREERLRRVLERESETQRALKREKAKVLLEVVEEQKITVDVARRVW